MNKNKKYLVSILLIVVAAIFTIVNVNTQEIGTANDTVIQKGKYNSTRFAAGKEVINKSEVNGLSFVAGEKLTLEGKAPYGFYAGKTLLVSESIESDAFIAGESITITEKANINRDLFIAGKNIKIKSTIGRDLRLGANTVDLSNAIIKGNAYIAADKIILNNNTKILGQLNYAKDTKVIGLNKDKIKKIKVTKARSNKKKKTTFEKVTEEVSNFIFSVIRAFLLIAILLWLIPKLDKKLTKEEFTPSKVAIKSLVGLAVLVIVPIVAILALISSILTPVSLIALTLLVVSYYLSSMFVYYIVGNYIDNKFIKKKKKYLSLICGIVLIKLLLLIPVLGLIVYVIVHLYGLGIIFDYINSLRKKTK